MYPKQIYFIRHAEAVSNVTHEFSYKRVDLDLTSKGELQAGQAAEALKSVDIDVIFTSPLKRAVATARKIHQANPAKKGLKSVELLREINVGELELKPPTDETWAIHDEVMAGWERGEDIAFPSGESLTSFLARIHNAFSKIAKYCQKYQLETAVVVAHGGTLYHLSKHYFKSEVDLPEKYHVDNASITKLRTEFDEYKMDLVIESFNNIDHLHGVAADTISGLWDYTEPVENE